MKKVALLFTILSVGALNAMEPEQKNYGHYMNPLLSGVGLPEELHALIISYLKQELSLQETVYFIKSASLVNKQLNAMINFEDFQGFTEIVHMLADKFGTFTSTVAEQFNTPTAKKYIELGKKLISTVKQCDRRNFDKIIKEGADINFSIAGHEAIPGKSTPLHVVIKEISSRHGEYDSYDHTLIYFKDTLIKAGAKE